MPDNMTHQEEKYEQKAKQKREEGKGRANKGKSRAFNLRCDNLRQNKSQNVIDEGRSEKRDDKAKQKRSKQTQPDALFPVKEGKEVSIQLYIPLPKPF
ncbi:hypothetical protein [Paenibacillus germinis]|uniref:hypothetical protein n=1 Tax=Paenibacillus germinis TaxID=2654979 RepID=UPI001FE82E5D|nr:hypothetical protein [Paenibacillus germinis]